MANLRCLSVAAPFTLASVRRRGIRARKQRCLRPTRLRPTRLSPLMARALTVLGSGSWRAPSYTIPGDANDLIAVTMRPVRGVDQS
jgi:hypothetical protein